MTRAELLNAIYDGKDPYVGFPAIWPGHFNTDGSERAILRETIDRVRPKLIIEVGSFLGGSAMWMAKHASTPTVLCVDTWLGGVDHWLRAKEKLRITYGSSTLYEHFMTNIVQAGLTEFILPFRLDSLNAARFLKERCITCQMLYIDGSHEQGDVLRDYEAYWQLLERGGAMVVDDLTNWFPGVLHDWELFTKSHGLTPVAVEGEKAVVIKP